MGVKLVPLSISFLEQLMTTPKRRAKRFTRCRIIVQGWELRRGRKAGL